MRNIVREPPVSLMFLIPGANNALRANGTASLTADDTLRARFTRDGKEPRTVIVIKIAEVCSQCARALIHSSLWTSGDHSAGLPTVGDMLRGGHCLGHALRKGAGRHACRWLGGTGSPALTSG